MMQRFLQRTLVVAGVLASLLAPADRGWAQGTAEPLKPEALEQFLTDILEEPKPAWNAVNEANFKYWYWLNKTGEVDGKQKTLSALARLSPDTTRLLIDFRIDGLPNLDLTSSVNFMRLLAANKEVEPAGFGIDLAGNFLYLRLALENKGLSKRAVRNQLEQVTASFAKNYRLADPKYWDFPGHITWYTTGGTSPWGHNVSSDGKLMFCGDENGKVVLWNLETSTVVNENKTESRGVRSGIFTPGNKSVIIGRAGGLLHEWDFTANTFKRTFDGHKHNIWALALSPDGKLVSAGGAEKDGAGNAIDGAGATTPDGDYGIRLWDLNTGALLRTFAGHIAPVRSVALTSDGRKLLSGGFDGTFRIWDAGSGKSLHVRDKVGQSLMAVMATPDGRGVTAGVPEYDTALKAFLFNKTVRLWNLDTGEELRSFGGHNVWCAAISPDGTKLLTGGPDKTLRVWDVASGRELKVLAGHLNSLVRCVFLPDGKRALTAGFDGYQRFWNID